MVRFVLRSEAQRAMAIEHIQSLAVVTPATIDNPLVEVIIREYDPPKTAAQGRYLWGVVYPHIRRHIIECVGEVYSCETIHQEMKERFMKPVLRDLTDGWRREDRKYTTKQKRRKFMARYTDAVLMYAAECLGCYIPEPNEEPEDDGLQAGVLPGERLENEPEDAC